MLANDAPAISRIESGDGKEREANRLNFCCPRLFDMRGERGRIGIRPA
jgi:hypothetical protein